MVGAPCLLPASCNVDARACTAVAAATRRTGPTLPGCGGRRSCTPSSHAPGFLLPAWLHPCIPQAGEPAGSGAEIWAEPACWAPGTPTGPARPGQSAGGGGEERERQCTEGELRTREWRVSMRCGPSPHAGWTEGWWSLFSSASCLGVCWGDLKTALDGEIPGKSLHHLIMQRGGVLVPDAVMNGIDDT